MMYLKYKLLGDSFIEASVLAQNLLEKKNFCSQTVKLSLDLPLFSLLGDICKIV